MKTFYYEIDNISGTGKDVVDAYVDADTEVEARELVMQRIRSMKITHIEEIVE